MSREELGFGSRRGGEAGGAPVELLDVEPVEQAEQVDEESADGLQHGRLRRALTGRLPAWVALVALGAGAGVGLVGGWAGQLLLQQRREDRRIDVRLVVTNVSSAAGGGSASVQIDAVVTNAGHRRLTVTGARVGPVQLRLLRPDLPHDVLPGGSLPLTLLGQLASPTDCAALISDASSPIPLQPEVLHVVDASGSQRDVFPDPVDPADPRVFPPLGPSLCPQAVTTPDARQVDVTVGKDGRTAVHLVLGLEGGSAAVTVTQLNPVEKVRPALPVTIRPGGTATFDLVLPPPDCPSAGPGAGFPPGQLDVVTHRAGAQSDEGSQIDLGGAYVRAVAAFIARCSAG